MTFRQRLDRARTALGRLRIFKRLALLDGHASAVTDMLAETADRKEVVNRINAAYGHVAPCLACGNLLDIRHAAVRFFRSAGGQVRASCVWCSASIKSRGIHEPVSRDELSN